MYLSVEVWEMHLHSLLLLQLKTRIVPTVTVILNSSLMEMLGVTLPLFIPDSTGGDRGPGKLKRAHGYWSIVHWVALVLDTSQ